MAPHRRESGDESPEAFELKVRSILVAHDQSKGLETFMGRSGRVSERLNRSRPLSLAWMETLPFGPGSPAELLVYNTHPTARATTNRPSGAKVGASRGADPIRR